MASMIWEFDDGLLSWASRNGCTEVLERDEPFDPILDLTADWEANGFRVRGRIVWNEVGNYASMMLGALPSEL